ncbi:MAG: choice-of-anchor Q domain-containing protein [Planctomycetota bacterium]
MRRRQTVLESLEDRRLLASFEVINLNDGGVGTLRDAIMAANDNPGPDTISFAPNVVGTITLDETLGSLVITDSVDLMGPGADQLTIDADATLARQLRVIDIDSLDANVAISGLTITGGLVDLDAGAGIRFRSSGTLTVNESVVSGNTANNGGGIYSEFDGNLVITSSTISGNTALYGDGGGISVEDGDTTIRSSVISDNQSYGSGAGVFSAYGGSVTISDSTITRNTVTYDGYHGGGIYSGEGDVTISGSTISGNTAAGDGGGVYNIDGQLDISFSQLQDNTATYGGGGIFHYRGPLSLRNVTLSGNVAELFDGGGIANDRGTVTVSRSTISGNSASSMGDGGGIATGGGNVTIIESLLSNNSAAYSGGGIATTTGRVTLTNSTVSGNRAGENGGGIQSDRAAVQLVNTTMTGNDALISGGGISFIDNDNGESLLIHNSIVAQNTAPVSADFLAPGGVGNLEVASSVIGTNDGTGLATGSPDANGNFIGDTAQPVDARLLPLDNNGGPTLTHALAASSPGVDAGDNSLAVGFGADGLPGGGDDTPLTADQRGGLYLRISEFFDNGPIVDMGAHETQVAPQYIVDTNEDTVDGDLSVGDRSLRELIEITNETVEHEVITFRFGLESPIELDPVLGELLITQALTINGPGSSRMAITIDPTEQFRLLRITGTGDVHLSGLTLAGGDAGDEDGGAILSSTTGSLEIVKSDLLGHSANSGGAIAMRAGSLAVVGSSVHGNRAAVNGGGILGSDDTGSITFVNSTVSGNTAGANGGGLFSENAAVIASSSTIAFNSAASSGGGIGFNADDSGETLQLINSIVGANTAPSGTDFLAPGAAFVNLSVQSSLIENNQDTTLFETGGIPDRDGNFIGSPANPIDPQLGPLQENGGRLPNHLPLEGSLAIDSADASLLPDDTFDIDNDRNVDEPLPRDQRGALRVTDTLDMGAVELGAVPNITWNDPADIVFGTPLTVQQLNASSPVNGTYIYMPGSGEILPAGENQTLSVQFTPSDVLQFRTTTVEVSINVLKADPVITWENPDDIVFGTALSDLQLNAVSNVLGSFAYDPNFGVVLNAGQQQLSAVFTPDDTQNYNTATANVILQVDQQTPIVSWDDPDPIVFGTALSETQLNATADVNGVFTYTPPIGTVLNAGDAQNLSVLFTPDNPNFETVTTNVSIDVTQAMPVISWDDPASIVFGTALDTAQLNAMTGIDGVFTYTPDFGTVLNAGDDQLLSVLFTPESTNFTTATATVRIDVQQAVPSLLWDDPADITFGTPLGSSQLNANASFDGSDLAGTYDYTPASGAVLSAGENQELRVVFTPESSNFESVSGSVLIDVAKADPVITWPNPDDIVVGTPLGTTQLNASAGSLPGSFEYVPIAGTVLPLGDGQQLATTFTPDDQANYNIVSATAIINVINALDYGDAPQAYPVLLADDGARHVVGNLRLGSEVDTESDGQVSPIANGDGDDDDGVKRIADAVADDAEATTASFLITASEAGQLDAWIDFNADGVWDDATEKILDSVAVGAGDHTVSYSIPAGSMASETAARFRLSSSGNLLPTGEAADGEVEDYLVTLLDGSVGANPQIQLVGPTTSIFTTGDGWQVSDGNNLLFAAPVSSVQSLQLAGTNGNDTFDLNLDGVNGLQIDGGSGVNVITVSSTEIDLTSGGNLVAENIAEFDLTDISSTRLTLDVNAVDGASPVQQAITVLAGAGDSFNFFDSVDWRMTTPTDNGVDFFLRARHMTGGQVVEIQSPTPWQNPLDPSDVDGNGMLTAADALRVINELDRRAFSDSSTQTLVDPLSLGAWPGSYYDQSGDNDATAIDALRVINQLARVASEGEGEWLIIPSASMESADNDVITEQHRFDRIQPQDHAWTAWDDPSTLRDQLPSAIINGDDELDAWQDGVDQLLSEDNWESL